MEEQDNKRKYLITIQITRPNDEGIIYRRANMVLAEKKDVVAMVDSMMNIKSKKVEEVGM